MGKNQLGQFQNNVDSHFSLRSWEILAALTLNDRPPSVSPLKWGQAKLTERYRLNKVGQAACYIKHGSLAAVKI